MFGVHSPLEELQLIINIHRTQQPYWQRSIKETVRFPNLSKNKSNIMLFVSLIRLKLLKLYRNDSGRQN